MYKLNDKSKLSVKKVTGIEADDISSMSYNQINFYIEKRVRKKLKFSTSDNSDLIVCSSIFLFLNRLARMFSIDKDKKHFKTAQRNS